MADTGGVDRSSVDLETGRAHGARIYDYILGGKDHYEADRAAGDETLRVWPALRVHMQANRSFMHRVARYMAVEKGIRQFLDIGTGIPTSPISTRSSKRRRPTPGWCTSTTIRSSWSTRGR